MRVHDIELTTIPDHDLQPGHEHRHVTQYSKEAFKLGKIIAGYRYCGCMNGHRISRDWSSAESGSNDWHEKLAAVSRKTSLELLLIQNLLLGALSCEHLPT